MGWDNRTLLPFTVAHQRTCVLIDLWVDRQDPPGASVLTPARTCVCLAVPSHALTCPACLPGLRSPIVVRLHQRLCMAQRGWRPMQKGGMWNAEPRERALGSGMDMGWWRPTQGQPRKQSLGLRMCMASGVGLQLGLIWAPNNSADAIPKFQWNCRPDPRPKTSLLGGGTHFFD